MRRYQEAGLQPADAAIAHLAEGEGIRTVSTLDRRDLSIIRLKRDRPSPTLTGRVTSDEPLRAAPAQAVVFHQQLHPDRHHRRPRAEAGERLLTSFTDPLPDKNIRAAYYRNDPLGMIKQRAKAAGLSEDVCYHTFRAAGITANPENGGTQEHAQQIAKHRSRRRQGSMTAPAIRMRLNKPFFALF